MVNLTADGYNCDATITIKVADIDQTVQFRQRDDRQRHRAGGEVVTLGETSTEGVYEDERHGHGRCVAQRPVGVDDSDDIVVTYIDANYGNGQHNVAKTDDAVHRQPGADFAGLVFDPPGDYEATWSGEIRPLT
jgi:hypothetical protein